VELIEVTIIEVIVELGVVAIITTICKVKSLCTQGR
jgi:hypothetical protein